MLKLDTRVINEKPKEVPNMLDPAANIAVGFAPKM